MYFSQKSNRSSDEATARRLFAWLSASVLLQACAVQNVAASEGSQQGFELEQKSLLVGKVIVRLTPTTVQFLDEAQGLVFISRAPSWNLLVINSRAKTFYEGKTESFTSSMTKGVTLFTGRTMTDVSYNQAPVKEPNGQWHFTSTAQYTKRETELKTNMYQGSKMPKTADVWSDPKISMVPQIVSLAGRMYGFASTKGMPIRVRYLDFDGVEKVFLKTVRITKRDFTDNDFEHRLPSFKRVSTISAVYRSEDTDEAVDEMLKGMEPGLKK